MVDDPLYWLVKLALFAVGLAWLIWRWRKQRKAGVKRITAPTAAFIDLSEGRLADQLQADTQVLSPHFSSYIKALAEGSRADVVFVYVDEAALGRVDVSASLDDMVRKLGASVLISAAANRIEYAAAVMKKDRVPGLHAVWTVGRTNERFHDFFGKLFTEMKAGVSMPVAWAKLLPYNPHSVDPEMQVGYSIGGQLAFG